MVYGRTFLITMGAVLLLLLERPAFTEGAPGSGTCQYELKTLGQALTLPPGFPGKSLNTYKDQLASIAQGIPLSPFPQALAGTGSVLLGFDKRTEEKTFQSVKSFITHGQFTDHVVLSIPTQTLSDDFVLKALNGMNLAGNSYLIEDKIVVNETLLLEMRLKTKRIVIAIYQKNVSEDCEDIDPEDGEKTLPQRTSTSPEAPKDFPFQSPLSVNLTGNYFFGPRLFNSLPLSIQLEKGSIQTPVTVISKKALKAQPKGNYSAHKGIDLQASTGNSVLAMADGTVYLTGWSNSAGYFVALRHENEKDETLFSLYFHLSRIEPSLKQDSPVKGGSKIGLSGCTGSSCQGAHLHVELREPLKGIIIPKGVSRRTIIFERVASVNLADYLKGASDLCQRRKTVEVENQIQVQKSKPEFLGPLSAGSCDEAFEFKIAKNYPAIQIYAVKSDSDLKSLK